MFANTLIRLIPRGVGLALALCLLASTALAQTGTVEGQITTTEGDPLPGVNVRVENTTLGAATGVDGRFTITGVPAGERTVIASLVGFSRATFSVNVQAGGTVKFDGRLQISPLRLSEIAITASRREQDLTDVPRAISVVQQERVELYAEQTSDLAATLGKFVPNFSSPSIGNSVFTATLRGRTPLFLLDGVPLRTSEGFRGAVLGNIDPSMLDRVEVLYGASTVYGGGAPGGVIQFFTKRASEKPVAVDIDLFGRNFLVDEAVLASDALDYRAAATVSGTQGKFRYVANGSFETTNGAFRPDGQQIAPINTSYYDDYTVLGKVGYDITPSQAIDLSITRTYREPNDLFFAPVARPEDVLADPDGSAAVAERVETAFSYDTPISQDYIAVNAQYQNSALFGGSLGLQGYYIDLNFQQGGSDIRQFVESGRFPSFWPGLFQTSTAASQYGARAEYNRPVNERVIVSVGGDFLQSEDSTPVTISTDGPFDAENRFDGVGGVQDQGAPTELTSGGVFVQADIDATDALNLSVGARYDVNSFEVIPFIPTFTRVAPGENRLGGSGSNSGLSLNLGAAFEYAPQNTVYTNFSQGFSLPSLAFLVVNIEPGVVIEGDEIVSPQVVNSVDLGFRGQLGTNFAYGVAGFFAFSEDASQIQFDTSTGQGMRLQAPQRNYGFEATINASPAQGLRIGADVAITETDVDPQDDGTFQPASSIEAIPLTTALRASYAIPAVQGLSVNAEVFTVNNR
ncbi:MAG: TonB-dependent receptor, partial [Bacteroidota bacterium]